MSCRLSICCSVASIRKECVIVSGYCDVVVSRLEPPKVRFAPIATSGQSRNYLPFDSGFQRSASQRTYSTWDLISSLGSGADLVVQLVASLTGLIFLGRSILTAPITY